MKKLSLLAFLLVFIQSVYAQDRVFMTGFFPEAALTKKLSNGNKINFKVENQEYFYRNVEDPSERWKVSHYRTDLMAFYDWKASPLYSLAFGVFHRIHKGANANRLIQQLAFIQRTRIGRLGHRIRTDQTFQTAEQVVYRLRYRLAWDIPLEGTTLDPGEKYLVISDEPIFGLQGEEFDIENRMVLSLGKLIDEQNKIEYSIDYRTDGFFQDGFRNRLWFKIGYFYNF